MDQDEFSVVEDYLRMNQYPKGISKGDKANLRQNDNEMLYAIDPGIVVYDLIALTGCGENYGLPIKVIFAIQFQL